MGGVLDQLQAAVAGHGLGDVHQQRLGDGEAGVALQRVYGLLGVEAGGAGVPQRQWGDAVGVDVLGRALELRKRGERGAGLWRVRVRDLKQDGLVRLDDQGAATKRHSDIMPAG